MADEPENLVLVLLREIRAQQSEQARETGTLRDDLHALRDDLHAFRMNVETRFLDLELRMSRLGASVSDLADSIDFVRRAMVER